MKKMGISRCYLGKQEGEVGGKGMYIKKGWTSRVNEGELRKKNCRNTDLEITCISPIYTVKN
jgi:hypothetical protein